jgi:nitric oxide synthase-interacting protein
LGASTLHFLSTTNKPTPLLPPNHPPWAGHVRPPASALTPDAKNTTTQANLSYYERLKLKQSTAARRLGQESFKPLDACNLCLSRASDPVACGDAHIFCRECAISDLLAQKAGIEAQKAQLRAWEDDDARRRADARDAARARVVADFERGMGLAGGRGTVAVGAAAVVGGRFRLDEAAVEAAAREAEERAGAAIEAEAGEARRAKIAAFWLPANAPSAPLGPLKAVKLQTLCHVGGAGKAHPIALKALLPVVLKYPPGNKGQPTCPSCQRDLSNASGAVLLTSREPAGAEKEDGEGPRKKAKKEKKDKLPPAVCGHVVCKTCAETVVKPAGRCCVCEAKVAPGEMLQLGSEGELGARAKLTAGTGYAASGGAEVKTSSAVVFRV